MWRMSRVEAGGTHVARSLDSTKLGSCIQSEANLSYYRMGACCLHGRFVRANASLQHKGILLSVVSLFKFLINADLSIRL